MLEKPFWGRGFRPFFFLGAFYSAVVMPLWIFFLRGDTALPVQDALFWHAHEMVFGFTAAIVAGFLLTAVANWTGGAPARQRHLAMLVLAWIIGRGVMFIPGIPLWAVIVAEALFLPALTVSLAIPLWRSRNARNFLFVGLLTSLLACDIASLLYGRIFLYVAVLIVMIMISVIGGRVIPAFTVAALRRRGIVAFQHPQPHADLAALAAGIALAASSAVFGLASIITGICAMAVGVINAWRVSRFNFMKSFSDPMLWILHIGFVWTIIGFFMLGLSGFDVVPASLALHAMTAGGIGTMCIGMMCRVALGHTGRDIHASKPTILMFVLIQISAILRVFGVWLFPADMMLMLTISGILWALAFILYVAIYAPILFAPRPDGATA